MAQPKITDYGIVVDMPEVERGDNPTYFLVRLKNNLTEKQKDKVEETIQKFINKYPEMVTISEFGDSHITIGAINSPNGHSDLKFLFQDDEGTLEAMLVGNDEVKRIFLHFFTEIQKDSNNKYIIFLNDRRDPNMVGIKVTSKGVIPVHKYEQDMDGFNKNLSVSIEDYLTNNKALKNAIEESKKKFESDEVKTPYFFGVFEHEEYRKIVSDYLEKSKKITNDLKSS